MTSAFDPDDHAWVFQRDEIDVLEEDLEQVYEFVEHLHLPQSAMEMRILKEQMDTEDRVEDEFVLNVGPELLHQDHADHDHTLEVDTRTSLLEQLKNQLERDPLYLQAYAWSDDLFVFAKNQYQTGENTSKDMFRVYLNAKMVPIKLSIGRMQDPSEDPFLFQLIQKEYDLALIYLDRTIESLNQLVVSGYQILIPFVKRGEQLRVLLEKAIRQFGTTKGTSPLL